MGETAPVRTIQYGDELVASTDREDTALLLSSSRKRETSNRCSQRQPGLLVDNHRRRISVLKLAIATIGVLSLGSACLSYIHRQSTTTTTTTTTAAAKNHDTKATTGTMQTAAMLKDVLQVHQHNGNSYDHNNFSNNNNSAPPATNGVPTERCDWVVQNYVDKYFWVTEDERKQQYAMSTKDSNVFYRATANIFWVDYVMGGWGNRINFKNIGISALQYDGTPLQPKSLWTWVTGDQHLSNFGAWKNRHGDVVFGVNDFDEAAIYDFGVDVLRIAVSVCSHAHTNGLSDSEVKEVLRAFTDTYVQTVINYVGSDRELTWELTPETSTGSMQAYLTEVQDDRSNGRQLEKFTEVDGKGNRRFIKNDKTRLVDVSPEEESKIRKEFTADRYGATMMKMGWRVRGWSDEFFEILDIAVRVGSGVGSYGVARYYVLLKGTDTTLEYDWADGNAVILDVKYEPPGAVAQVLSPEDTAWYGVIFENDAERAVQAQRRLTSYTDPFTGWIIIDDKPFVVRQRSPWKNSPDLDTIKDSDNFIDFMEQVAVSTATSHVRGTVSKSPGQFKHVLASALEHYRDRTAWGRAIQQVAMDYREQVLLDFACFKRYVDEYYPSLDGETTSGDDGDDD